MTNEKINAMVEAINFGIEGALYEFKNHGSSEFYNREYARICGMIRMLEIVTDKKYYFDETGLHERLQGVK